MSDSETSRASLDALIKEAYRVVAEPARLADFQVWFEDQTAGLDAHNSTLDEHLGIAGTLFDAIPESEARDFSRFGVDSETASLAPDANALLRLDADLRVVAIDDPALADTGLRIGDDFAEWLASDRDKALTGLRAIAASQDSSFAQVVRFYAEDGDDRGVLGLATRSAGRNGHAVLVRRMGLRWSVRDRQTFASAFGLTKTETELVRFLVEARSIADFAASRGRSVDTARTQLKRLQRKLAVGSQSEIISLYAGFVGLLASDTIAAAGLAVGAGASRTVTLGAQEIRYETYGDPSGRPVLVLHGALEGPYLPLAAQHEAGDRGIWLIIPWMPFYTGDGGGLPAVERIEQFAAMLPAFLDAVGVERCPILACSLATAYAFAALTHSPERFSGLVLAGMAVPLTEIEDRSTINPAWRAPMELGQRFPRFFELFARAMFRLALRGEFHQYFDKLFKDGPADLAVLRDPDVAATLRRAAENRPDRFGAAMAHGFAIMTTDWSRWMDFGPVPVRLVHGADDVVAKPRHIADFSRKYGIDQVGPIDGLGGFSLFQDPGLVMQHIVELYD